MASTIITKYGSGAPTASDLVQGELAVDLTNKRLYTEDSGGNVIEVGINPSSLTIGGTALTATAAELNTLDGITATTAELNTLDGITATVTELNYTDGVTSNIQTQLNTKAPIASPTFTGTVTAPAVNVNGTVTADGLLVQGESYFDTNNGGRALHVTRYGNVESESANFTIDDNDLIIDSVQDEQYGGYSFKATYSGTGTRNRLDIANNGDISFYEDTGTTAKFYWDASAERLGIGGSSPAFALDVNGGTDGVISILRSTDNLALQSFRDDTTGSDGFVMIGANGPNMVAYTQGVERMRINASGNLLVGTTDSTPENNSTASSASNGFVVDSNGKIKVGQYGGSCAIFNRVTTDGPILDFRKDGTTVGSIGTNGGDVYIGTGISGFKFADANPSINPHNTSSNTTADNSIDIGTSSARFKNLYLSGGVYLGGTGAANLLDDYEEGTWTPVLGAQSNTSGTWDSTLTGTYTKVGRLVHIQLSISGTGMAFDTTAGYRYYSGLPFSVEQEASAAFTSGAISGGLAGAAICTGSETLYIYAPSVASTTTSTVQVSMVYRTT